MKNILNTRLRRCHLMMSFLSLVVIAGLVFVSLFIPSNVSAEVFEAEQGLSFTLNSSVAVSITGGTGSGSDGLTIEDLVPGDYKDSNIITVTASSNNVSGYTLSSSVGSSTYASTELRRNGTETANKFTSLTANKASLSAFDPGYWGYSYSTDSGSTWISGDIVSGTSAGYNGLPLYTTTTPIKLINSSSASSSSIQFKIGAKATSSQVSGAYTNIINFIGVGKVITTNYAITFSDPSGEASGMPSQQTGTTDSGAVQLPSTVPTRTNYIFKGWCTIQVADGGECTGTGATQIQPSGFLALNAGTSPSNPEQRTLYAMWKGNSPIPPFPENCPEGQLCMQTMNVSDCPSTGGTAYDGRDGSDYTIRLIDGTCWMTQNLRIMNTVSAEWSNFTGSDFNITVNSLTVGNSYTEARSTYNNNISYGAYYNFCAVSAGRVCDDTTQAEITQDICPKNWRLSNIGELYSIGIVGGGVNWNGVAAGAYSNGSLNYIGVEGQWWSSSPASATTVYDLDYDLENVSYAFSSYEKYYGFSARCVMAS